MAQTNKNNIGFFSDKKKKHSSDMSYQPNIPAKETYDSKPIKVPEAKEQTEAAKPATRSQPAAASAKPVKDVRRTIRVPQQTFIEVQALLELSPNKYIYEILEDLVDEYVQSHVTNNPEWSRAYQASLERIRMTDARKRNL